MLKIVGILITIGLILGAIRGHAAERMGSNTVDAYFKIDGKKATAQEADKAAPNHRIEKCTPIKNSEPQAYKCNEVVKEYSARTGNATWKRP